MSRQQQDADENTRSRPRANTTSVPPFARRRTRVENTLIQHSSISSYQQPSSLETLIDALTPPAVPSLVYARNLANLLASHSPLHRRAALSPVLSSLCSTDSPVAVQAAGYDILSAYCENDEAIAIETAELLSYFSLFLNSNTSWEVELWEPRFKALRALTKYGNDVIGIELEVLRVLKLWISGAFEGLLKIDPTLERAERAERERSTDVLAKFLITVLSNIRTAARISEDDVAGVLDFYAGLVDRSVVLVNKTQLQDRVFTSSLLAEGQSSPSTPSKLPSQTHRRNHSSVSTNSMPSPAPTPNIASPHSKHPADIAITLYLDHLSSYLKTLPHSHLPNILPLLFRALAFCASPLPRLSVSRHPTKKPTSEDKITETLSAFFSGPYATICMLILKKYLHPSCYFIQKGETVTCKAISGDASKQLQNINTALYTSLGAHRTFRNYVRRALVTRLARAYISRMTSVNYSPSGAPGHMNLESELMEQAWAKEDYTTSSLGLGNNGWDAARLGKVLTRSVEAWVQWHADGIQDEDGGTEKIRMLKEDILEEAAGVLKDIWQELDNRSEDEQADLDEEEAVVVGETLEKLAEYVTLLKNRDGTPYILPVSQSPSAPTVFLRSLSVLLSRSHAPPTNPPLSAVLIHISDNLTDSDTADLPRIMAKQHDLSPASPQWLNNWKHLLNNASLTCIRRPLTRRAIMKTLLSIYDSVHDMKIYRRPLAEMVLEYCTRSLEHHEDDGKDDVAWRILGDEVVLRAVESAEQPDGTISRFIDLFEAVVFEEEREEYGDTASIATANTHSPSPQVPTPSTTSSVPSPNPSRTQSEHTLAMKEREKDPSIMSIITSLTTGHSSRSQAIQSLHSEGLQDDHVIPASQTNLPPISRVVTAVSALVFIFSHLVFTPFTLEHNIALALRTYHTLLNIVNESKAVRARLVALQFLMRLRADRDHRLYFTQDTPTQVIELATIINRASLSSSPSKNRDHVTSERDGRQLSRDQASGRLSRTPTTSRSRSRAANTLPQTTSRKNLVPLWYVPEDLPFALPDVAPSEGLVSYNPDGGMTGSPRRTVLPLSLYLNAIIRVLAKETSWDVLSYVLVHLPAQLANKHLFCGPRAREAISKMLSTVCTGILNNEMATQLEDQSIKARDAQGLAFQTLSVLVSYRRCFDLKQCHVLIEVLQSGLSFGQFSTIKCCLHALSLSAFELQSSVTKYLPRILEMLAQIMSGANIAVHILSFLFLTGAAPSLYANFTVDDFRMVFGVALQYLQHYNRLDSDPTQSWALSQHVRILSYTVVYIWFLALKLPDRAQHVPYITRQLLLANRSEEEIDDPTEVCFDWIARYTYASADPRPAPSVLSDILMNHSEEAAKASVGEKSWVLGNSVVTVRALAKRGWFETLCRRPSGFTKFLCRTENAPLVGAGDVNPDLFSVPMALIIERDTSLAVSSDRQMPSGVAHLFETERTEEDKTGVLRGADDLSSITSHPDPMTGYVWSGTAPSQRRKDVTINPSFFLLQLSAYPDRAPAQMINDQASVARFVSVLDRIPVIDTHKVGVMYVAPGQTDEADILRNSHGSPAYTRFLEGLGRLINLRGQRDVYAGGLDPDEDGEYAYAWWDDIGQVLYHTATMMPTSTDDPQSNNKKRHIGNDYVRIVWNDSGHSYRFDTLTTQFQFINIVIEPHSLGAIAAFSNNVHENEYFRVTVQRAPGMAEFAPVDDSKLVSAESLPLYTRQLSQLADWFASVFADTQQDTMRVERKTNWRMRLESIRRFKNQLTSIPGPTDADQGVMSLQSVRDFTTIF